MFKFRNICLTRDQCILLAMPCILTVFLWLIVSVYTHDTIPRDFNITHWKNFTNELELDLRQSNEDHVMMYLLVIHALQVLCCAPLMHITKILYGFFFGTVTGGIIGSVWEMSIVVVFVMVCIQNKPAKPAPENLQLLLDYVESLRQKKTVYIFLVGLQMASLPLITASSLVLFGIVSTSEFLFSHLIVTLVMTFKDTFLGGYIVSSDGEPKSIVLVSLLFIVSTLLPSILTIVIMGLLSQSALKALELARKECAMGSTESLMQQAFHTQGDMMQDTSETMSQEEILRQEILLQEAFTEEHKTVKEDTTK